MTRCVQSKDVPTGLVVGHSGSVIVAEAAEAVGLGAMSVVGTRGPTPGALRTSASHSRRASPPQGADGRASPRKTTPPRAARVKKERAHPERYRRPGAASSTLPSKAARRDGPARGGRLSAEARGLVGNSAWGRSMFARRGGLAMATHGRHILLDNVKQIAARRRAKRGKGLEAPSGYRNQPVFFTGASLPPEKTATSPGAGRGTSACGAVSATTLSGEAHRLHPILALERRNAFDGPCVADYAGRMLRALALAVVVASAAGCGRHPLAHAVPGPGGTALRAEGWLVARRRRAWWLLRAPVGQLSDPTREQRNALVSRRVQEAGASPSDHLPRPGSEVDINALRALAPIPRAPVPRPSNPQARPAAAPMEPQAPSVEGCARRRAWGDCGQHRKSGRGARVALRGLRWIHGGSRHGRLRGAKSLLQELERRAGT